MASIQENSRSPQLLLQPRGSPSGSITKSPSQLSTICLSSSPSPARKRAHPNYLKIDDAAPPNKKINTPTKEEKETIMKEKQMLYKRLAEENRGSPFYLSPFPILPLGNQFTPSIYSILQKQQHPGQPQQAFQPNLILPPSTPMDLSHTKLGASLAGSTNTLSANSPGSNSSVVMNTAGISGLPTPGGSSVGTPPRPLYPSQIYPTQLLNFSFSPPTPSSQGLLSPWNLSTRSMSVSSSVATPGAPNSNKSVTGEDARNEENGEVVTSSTPKIDGESAADSSAKMQDSQSPSRKSQATNGIPVSTPSIQSKPHLKLPYSIQSPLGLQTPFSPALHGSTTFPASILGSTYPGSIPTMQGSSYPGSVSSCPSVSSSSGCSSASESQDLQHGAASLLAKNYALSEYHVGPHKFISSEKDMDNQSEEATTSGRNTPLDPNTDDSEGCVLPSDVSGKLISSGQCYPPLPGHGALNSDPSTAPSAQQPSKIRQHTAKRSRGAKANSPHPFSVESLSSTSQPSSVNQQGYVAGCHIIDRPSSGVSSMSSSLSSRDSTPEPEEMKHDPTQPPQGADVFCLVPGRLSLLSSTQKYKVTVDEVRRRLSNPECLNASVLGGILRRAKSKNGGTVLRQRLGEIGVSLPPGRRKQTELSLLTSLVESESLHLASDFNRVCENYFPHAELGQIIARQHVGTPEAQHRISMVKATQLIVSELQAMLEAVGGPSNIRPNDPNNPYPGLTNFSLLTHGFGNPALNTGLGVLQTYLQELLAYYEGKKSIQTPENRYSMFNDGSAPSQQHVGMGSQVNSDSIPNHHHQPHTQHHPLQNPLMYATRHYPTGGVEAQEVVVSSDAEGEVTLKEEPESPNAFST